MVREYDSVCLSCTGPKWPAQGKSRPMNPWVMGRPARQKVLRKFYLPSADYILAARLETERGRKRAAAVVSRGTAGTHTIVGESYFPLGNTPTTPVKRFRQGGKKKKKGDSCPKAAPSCVVQHDRAAGAERPCFAGLAARGRPASPTGRGGQIICKYSTKKLPCNWFAPTAHGGASTAASTTYTRKVRRPSAASLGSSRFFTKNCFRVFF